MERISEIDVAASQVGEQIHSWSHWYHLLMQYRWDWIIADYIKQILESMDDYDQSTPLDPRAI